MIRSFGHQGYGKLVRGFLVAVICLTFLPATFGCAGLKHIWSPFFEVSENKDDVLEAFSRFIAEKLQTIASGAWAISSAEEGKKSLHDQRLKDCLVHASIPGLKWADDFEMLNQEKNKSLFENCEMKGVAWVNILKAGGKEHVSLDLINSFPVILRRGRADNVVGRVMAVTRDGEIKLIDEFPFFLRWEIDFTFPVSSQIGGIWIRRVFRQVYPSPPREWLLFPPPTENNYFDKPITESFFLDLRDEAPR